MDARTAYQRMVLKSSLAISRSVVQLEEKGEMALGQLRCIGMKYSVDKHGGSEGKL